MVCPLVVEIIHELKLMNYLPVQADKPWYIYYTQIVESLLYAMYIWNIPQPGSVQQHCILSQRLMQYFECFI